LVENQIPDTMKARGDVVVVDLDDERERALNLSLNNAAISGHWTAELRDVVAGLSGSLPADLFAGLRLEDLRIRVPEAVEQKEPIVSTDVFVSIRATPAAFAKIESTLREWSSDGGISVDVSR
jgi:hypothetical protein